MEEQSEATQTWVDRAQKFKCVSFYVQAQLPKKDSIISASYPLYIKFVITFNKEVNIHAFQTELLKVFCSS